MKVKLWGSEDDKGEMEIEFGGMKTRERWKGEVMEIIGTGKGFSPPLPRPHLFLIKTSPFDSELVL